MTDKRNTQAETKEARLYEDGTEVLLVHHSHHVFPNQHGSGISGNESRIPEATAPTPCPWYFFLLFILDPLDKRILHV